MFDPGKANQAITIQAVTNSVDDMGATAQSWATVSDAPTWAEYIPLRGIERVTAGKMEGQTEFKLRIRRYASLTTSHRVVHASNNCEILAIEDNHRAGDMVLWCRVRD